MIDESFDYKNYNPDVISTLANLSSDEVFTPPEVVNSMLDMLPKELWSDKKAKFLDPATKSGIFLREIAKRLIDGLENEIPDLQERLDHIFHNQLYGIAITELTSLLSRRSLYGSKFPNSVFSFSTFNSLDGNIRFERTEHTWSFNKCIYCGAPKSGYNRSEIFETHAYEFIHKKNIKEIYNMKFDVIIGNPPYQLSDGGGTGDSAKPIYNLFINQAKKMNPRYLSMIIPSRWMKGGKGLNDFREDMMSDLSLKEIFDFEDASEIFPGIHLDGGVCYFLWSRDYSGKVSYKYHSLDGNINKSSRYLKTDISETIIRDPRQISIIEKAGSFKEKRFDEIVSPRNPFGFNSDFFNRPGNYKSIDVFSANKEGLIEIHGVKGKKGGAKRVSGYIKPNHVLKELDSVNKFKLFFSKAFMTTSTVPPELILGYPGMICTETFLKIGDFSSEEEMLNCLKYIKTKFFRALLFFNRHSLNISRSTFNYIPMQDFKKEITDVELYKKYNLTQVEIDFIEKIILPMD